MAADQALFVSLLKTGRRDEARQLARHGVEHSGQYASFYRQWLQMVESDTPREIE